MRTSACGIAPLVVAAALAASLSAQKNDKDAKSPVSPVGSEAQRPKLALKAQPSIGIAPTRVVLTAEFTGGSNDFEEYYCPTVRWEWGDLSSSESATDCPPYEAGKSEIKRRFTVDHKFDRAGSYKVYFRIKHGSKEVAATSTTIKLQPGAHDIDP
jgi:hypothetical protein